MKYCTRAIITHGSYILYPIFHCGLYCRAVSVTDILCTKHGNSSIFWSKIRGLQLRAVSTLERVLVARMGYISTTLYSTRLAQQKFYLEKDLLSELSQVKFKNDHHLTRSSF